MLIEFSVENFASFRERQTLSMVAAPQLRRHENTFTPRVKGERLPRLLKVVAIYGPNASGKSNLIRALSCIQKIANRSPSANALPLPVLPFRFDRTLAEEPSKFEIHFIEKGCRYSFELSALPDRITFERLIAFPRGLPQLLYERARFASGDAYNFGEHLEGGRELHDVWRKSTGPRVLFIAQAIANSSEEFSQLRAPFDWLTDAKVLVTGNLKAAAEKTQQLTEKNPEFSKSLQRLLNEIDVPITEIRTTSVEQYKPITALSLAQAGGVQSDQNKISKLTTTLTHRTALGDADFDLSEESEGTQNLIGFWLPWYITRLQLAYDEAYGQILIVDELDASLHPNIIDALIAQHLTGEKPSQLIFTSHNTHLMDKKILRRDQFWLTERDENGATQLRSVHDFKGRDSEDIEKRYFEGKYRSLPHLTR